MPRIWRTSRRTGKRSLIHVPTYILNDRGMYVEGCLPRKDPPGTHACLKVMGTDGIPGPVPDGTPDVIVRSFIKAIINQAQQGSCCGSAYCAAGMVSRAMQGLPHILFAQSSIYGPGNGGRDQGMSIDTGFKVLFDQGALPADYIDQYDWKGYWNKTWPSDYKKVAANYRAIEGFDCRTYDDIVSCNKRGIPVVYGCKGHAVVRVWDGIDINSWGTGWGDRGIGQWATRREVEQSIDGYGAVGVRVMRDTTSDGPSPRLLQKRGVHAVRLY